MLRKWLTSGYFEGGLFHDTVSGTPQGVIWPTWFWTGWRRLRSRFAHPGPGPRGNGPLRVHHPLRGRFHRDPGPLKESLERDVKPIVEAFLRDGGWSSPPREDTDRRT